MAHLADESGKAGLPGQRVREVREEVSSDLRTPAGGGRAVTFSFPPCSAGFGIFILSTDVN